MPYHLTCLFAGLLLGATLYVLCFLGHIIIKISQAHINGWTPRQRGDMWYFASPLLNQTSTLADIRGIARNAPRRQMNGPAASFMTLDRNQKSHSDTDLHRNMYSSRSLQRPIMPLASPSPFLGFNNHKLGAFSSPAVPTEANFSDPYHGYRRTSMSSVASESETGSRPSTSAMNSAMNSPILPSQPIPDGLYGSGLNSAPLQTPSALIYC